MFSSSTANSSPPSRETVSQPRVAFNSLAANSARPLDLGWQLAALLCLLAAQFQRFTAHATSSGKVEPMAAGFAMLLETALPVWSRSLAFGFSIDQVAFPGHSAPVDADQFLQRFLDGTPPTVPTVPRIDSWRDFAHLPAELISLQ